MMADQPTQIEEILQEIDRADCRRNDYEYGAIFQKARDVYKALGDEQRAEQLHWELEVWSLIPIHA
ncbi:MAG: hypothetical protein ACRDJH_00915 [Thermomicrobiales bacterium]